MLFIRVLVRRGRARGLSRGTTARSKGCRYHASGESSIRHLSRSIRGVKFTYLDGDPFHFLTSVQLTMRLMISGSGFWSVSGDVDGRRELVGSQLGSRMDPRFNQLVTPYCTAVPRKAGDCTDRCTLSVCLLTKLHLGPLWITWDVCFFALGQLPYIV